MRSLKIIITLLLTMSLLCQHAYAAGQQSTTAAELVNDEKVIYVLPDAGTVIPSHPLFIIKQLRDEIESLITLDKPAKIRQKLKLADRYIVYAQALALMSKPVRTIQSAEQAVNIQYEAYNLLRSSLTQDSQSQELKDLRFTFIQSNIKQAEILRSLISTLPKGEQDKLLTLLDRNITLRKTVQAEP